MNDDSARRREQRYRAFFDNAPMMYVVTENRGGTPCVAECNALFLEVLGYEREEVEGRPLSDFYSPESESALYEGGGYERALDGRFIAEERHLVTRDGRVVETLLRALPEADDEGRVTGTLAMFLDITESKRAEKIRKAKEAAEAANEAKSRFLANMSHEIRTPMNAILGMSRLLLKTDLGEIEREYVEILYKAGEGMLQLIDDILDFSRIEAGRLELRPVDVDLLEVIDQLVALLEPRAAERGLELRSEIAEGLPRQIRVDSDRLRQVLLNLVGNAIKFTEKGWVAIRAGRAEGEAGHLRFEVRDTGVGIDPGVGELLFEPFTQADLSTTRRFGGTGLGLAICKRLVELMGGEIGFESRPGAGSLFYFTVAFEPARETAGPAEELAQKSSAFPSGHQRVLVVEDDPVNQLVVTRLLEKAGYQVKAVTGGFEALEILKRELYDLVFMDCQMPEIDGYEATRRIRRGEAGNAKIPIVALTAHAMKGDREKCLAAGMDDYLPKPLREGDLAEVLRRWLS